MAVYLAARPEFKMPFRLEIISVQGVKEFFRRVDFKMNRLSGIRADTACNKRSQESKVARSSGVSLVMNLPVFSPRYWRIALLSKMTASPSTRVGAFAFGLIAR